MDILEFTDTKKSRHLWRLQKPFFYSWIVTILPVCSYFCISTPAAESIFRDAMVDGVPLYLSLS